MKFSIKDFYSKCDQIRSFLRIWSHLLKISLGETNLIYWSTGPTHSILNKNKKILQNFGQLAFFNLLFSAFWKKKKKQSIAILYTTKHLSFYNKL